jgi:hypothetical protein
MIHPDDRQLYSYFDGELGSTARRTLEAHLAECAPCRQRLAECQDTRCRLQELLPPLTIETRQAGFWEQLQAALPVESGHPLSWLLLAPAILLVSVGITLQWLSSASGLWFTLREQGLAPDMGALLTNRVSQGLSGLDHNLVGAASDGAGTEIGGQVWRTWCLADNMLGRRLGVLITFGVIWVFSVIAVAAFGAWLLCLPKTPPARRKRQR